MAFWIRTKPRRGINTLLPEFLAMLITNLEAEFLDAKPRGVRPRRVSTPINIIGANTYDVNKKSSRFVGRILLGCL